MRTDKMNSSNRHWLALPVIVAVLTTRALAAVEAEYRCCGACAERVCGHPGLDPSASMPLVIERAPIVFLGRVVRAETNPCCERLADVTFRIIKGYKAMVLQVVTLRTGGACDSPFPFVIGRDYLVVASWSPGPRLEYQAYCGYPPIAAESARDKIQELDTILLEAAKKAERVK